MTSVHTATASLSTECAVNASFFFGFFYETSCVRTLSPVIPALAAVDFADAAAKTHLPVFNTSLVESTFTTTSSCSDTHTETRG